LGSFHRGSYVADGDYDVRVTERCRREDLGVDPDQPLEGLAEHEIVKALCHKHEHDPTPPDTVGPVAGELSLGVLRYGHDHRGATWFDRPNEAALWLCAYRFHRSGQDDDAFPYFEELRDADRIYPTNADRVRLFHDPAVRLVDAIPTDAERLVQEASARAGTEVRGKLGPLAVRLVVTEVDELRELHAAISMRGSDPDLLTLALVGLCPEPDELGDWRPVAELPTGPLDPVSVELGYSCLLPSAAEP
jgi:hypothetical protein